MLKSSKGEMSAGLIIGLVLVVAIIIGLIVWSRSNKADDMTQEENVNMVETQSSTTTSTLPNGAQTTTTTTTTVPVDPATNPTLPQTGMGPDAE